jgi:hypothetical protein
MRPWHPAVLYGYQQSGGTRFLCGAPPGHGVVQERWGHRGTGYGRRNVTFAPRLSRDHCHAAGRASRPCRPGPDRHRRQDSKALLMDDRPCGQLHHERHMRRRHGRFLEVRPGPWRLTWRPSAPHARRDTSGVDQKPLHRLCLIGGDLLISQGEKRENIVAGFTRRSRPGSVA